MTLVLTWSLGSGAWSRPFGHFGRFSMPVRMPEFHVALKIGFQEG